MSSHLPIFKSALDLCVYVEIMVKSFEKYHKYTIGHDMRAFAKEMLFLINRVNLSKNRVEIITKLRDKCEDMKMLLLLAKELKAYKNFNQFLDCFTLFAMTGKRDCFVCDSQ